MANKTKAERLAAVQHRRLLSRVGPLIDLRGNVSRQLRNTERLMLMMFSNYKREDDGQFIAVYIRRIDDDETAAKDYPKPRNSPLYGGSDDGTAGGTD
jgi:hypothetical protein